MSYLRLSLASLAVWVVTLNGFPVVASPLKGPRIVRHQLENLPVDITQPDTIQVGSLSLTRCPYLDQPIYCGFMDRALDPAGEVLGSLAIGFEYIPRLNQSLPALGTIVAVEGGPGYPTTGSRASYLSLFRPLLNQRNLLLVDNRGTGRSGAINCLPLQIKYPFSQSDVARCGEQLGNRSDLYGSGLAADDLAAILQALETGPVDLYGDSYGTYFSQAFAARHPNQLRSVTLDGAYAVLGLSPWYPANAATMRSSFDIVCRRSVTCRDLTGGSLDRIENLLAILRVSPIAGIAPDGNGTPTYVTANPGSLAHLMFAAAFGPAVYRELDAAARAYLEFQDSAPLLRMIAENQTPFDSSNARLYSNGLFVAVSCSDYPQIYDMTATLSVRRQQRNRSIASQQINSPDIYAPFTIAEFNLQPLDFSLLDLCLTWPIPSAAHPPGQPIPPGAQFTTAPTLVLSGELDSLTSPPDGATAAGLFTNGQQVIVANSFHVTALGDLDNCASDLVRSFISTLTLGDTGCAQRIREVRTVPAFATDVAQLTPANPQAGNQGTTQDLQLASAAAYTVGDVLTRWWVNYDGAGVGLRGGGYRYSYLPGNFYHFELDKYRWVSNSAISGSLTWNLTTGQIIAQLELPNGGNLQVEWNDEEPEAVASLSGEIEGRIIRAIIPAP